MSRATRVVGAVIVLFLAVGWPAGYSARSAESSAGTVSAAAASASSDVLAGRKKEKKKKRKGNTAGKARAPTNPDDLRVVDCLLPGQVRKLGRQTYLTQRRPARTTALDCAIRGGEYVDFDRANYATALKVWLASAEQGDAEAQYYVGEIYERGLGTDPDYAAAATWYQRSAEQGHSSAQFNLGFLYEKGLGVERDMRKATDWYRKASGLSGKIMLDSELAAIRDELAETRNRMSAAEQALVGLEEKLETSRRDLEAERSSSSRSASRVSELEARVGSLTSELGSRQTEVSRLRELQARYSLAGPNIEIIDIGATRGGEPPVSGETEELVGRVEAPAGLASFTVDGRAGDIDDEGFFSVPRDGRPTITFVAVDLQGKRGELVYDGTGRQIRRGAPDPRRARRPSGSFGNYHALVIGNDDYQSFPDLKTATHDAREIAGLLESRYGFSTTVLLNATNLDILAGLDAYRKELSEKDNLLVYYAGHGEIDERTGMGYWVPVDGERNDTRNWISSRRLSTQLSLLSVRHVLVIADSCYSSALTRSSLASFSGGDAGDRERWIKEVAGRPSRTALTSGGLQPVLDVGGGGHSIFARVVLDVLSGNSDVLETRNLWEEVRARVEHRSKMYGRVQRPEYAPMRFAGHSGGGEFFFVPVSG